MRIKALLLALAVSLTMLGCADINTTNELIAGSNQERLDSYSRGLVACGDNAACQVGLSSAYFSGAGQQQLFRPDTPVDYLKAGIPYASLALQAYQVWGGGGTADIGRATILVKGDGNTISAGNKLTASGSSTVNQNIEASMVRGAIGGDGTMTIDTSDNTSTPTVVEQPPPVVVDQQVVQPAQVVQPVIVAGGAE